MIQECCFDFFMPYNRLNITSVIYLCYQQHFAGGLMIIYYFSPYCLFKFGFLIFLMKYSLIQLHCFWIYF